MNHGNRDGAFIPKISLDLFVLSYERNQRYIMTCILMYVLTLVVPEERHQPIRLNKKASKVFVDQFII